ncbi:41_t:CDS:2, partial [Scutellospora calospora]
LSHNEEIIDDITNIMSFLKENDVHNDNDFIVSVEEFKFENLYIEEPLISIKSNKHVQDLPTKVIEIIPLIIDDIDLNVQNDQLVPEETGVKAPLEMLNEWEGINESTFEEISDSSFIEFEVQIDPFLSSRETLQLEPAIIPIKHDPLEIDRKKRRKTIFGSENEAADDKDVTITDSLAQTIKSVISEDATLMHQKLDDETALQFDLEKILEVDNPSENWKSVIMWQSMDELGGLKFKVSQITRGSVNDDGTSFPLIPTKIFDLIARPNSMHSDFQILTSFSGMKALEFELHWNPIKNISQIEFEEIVNVKISSQKMSDTLKDLCSCANSDDILDTVDVQFFNELNDPHLIARKEKHKGESLSVYSQLSNYDKSIIGNKDNIIHTNDLDSSKCFPADGEVIVENSSLCFSEYEKLPPSSEQQNFSNLQNTPICNEVSSRAQFDFKGLQNSLAKQNQNANKSGYFTGAFSATKSIDDFLILRGKITPQNIDSKKRFKYSEVPSINNTPKDNTTPDDRYTRYAHIIPFPSPVSQLTDSDKSNQSMQSVHVMARTIIDNMPMPVITHKYIVSIRLLANRGLLSALKSIDCKVE